MFEDDINREQYAVVCPGAKTEGFGHLYDMFEHVQKLVEHNTLACTTYYHHFSLAPWELFLTIRGHGCEDPFPDAPDWSI